MSDKYILVASCPDKIGIVRSVSDFFFQKGLSIIEAGQYTATENQRFFMRWELGSGEQELPNLEIIKTAFSQIAQSFHMNWEIHDSQVKTKILIAVSKYGHCLNDLLFRWQDKKLPAEIVGVVSNHETFKEKVKWYGLPYYHLPVNKENKKEQELKLLEIMDNLGVDLLVLARYMQILSDDLCQKVKGRAINIHHSFLPSFKGAKPYHQAFDRGVKIMGATAHYVTSDLDEGPIIEQDIQRVDHYHNSAEMVRLGSNVETQVLAKAVIWHCQHRILINNQRTVIFK